MSVDIALGRYAENQQLPALPFPGPAWHSCAGYAAAGLPRRAAPSETAICADRVIRAAVNRLLVDVVFGEAERRTPATGTLDALHRGNSPKASADNAETPRVNSKTVRSGRQPRLDPDHAPSIASPKPQTSNPRSPIRYQQHAFAQQLSKMLCLRPNGHAKAELVLASSVARLKHHHDVRAGDQQYQCHQRHQNFNRRPGKDVNPSIPRAGRKSSSGFHFFSSTWSDCLLYHARECASQSLLGLHGDTPGRSRAIMPQAPPFRRAIQGIVGSEACPTRSTQAGSAAASRNQSMPPARCL